MIISAAALSLSNPLPARPAAPSRAEDRSAQERAFALPPEPPRDEAPSRAPVKIGKSTTQAPAMDVPEAGRDDASPSTEKPKDQRPAETASKTEDATGPAVAVTVDEKPATDKDAAFKTETAAQDLATPVLVQVPPLAEAVAAIILPVEGGEASAPNPSAPPAGNAVVATPAISVPDKTVVAPLPSGLPAPDAASESLSQQPATAVVAQSGLKAGVKAQKPGDGLPAELIAGDKGASELAQRAEQPQQAQAAQAAAHRPADGSQLGALLSNLQVAANPSAPPAGNAVVATPAISVPDKTVVAPLPSGLPAPDAASESLSQQPATAVVAQSGLKAGVKAQKPGDGLPAELIAGDKGASELAQRVEQPQQAQAAQAAVHRPADGSQLDTLLSNLQVAANPSAPPASILQPPRPEGAEAHLAKAIPPSAVPIEIGLRALQGAREFQIRLDPAELGRVDVRLEIGDDKSVSAKVVVDRVETLHLLQREARTLERAFEQAGLKSSDSGIDITLRDHGQQSNQQRSEAFTDEIGGRARKAAAAPTILPADIPVRRSLHVGALDRSI